MLGSHPILEFPVTQPTVALSSGEAEFYAIVKGITTGLYLKNLLQFLAHVVNVRVKSDSSAGRGMISRLGVGKKVKHIDTQFMFAQGVSRDGTVQVVPVPGLENVAGIGTKYVTKAVLDKLLRLLRMVLAAMLAMTASPMEPTGGKSEGSMPRIGVQSVLWAISDRL